MLVIMVVGLLVFLAVVSKAEPVGTGWTYQGRLIDANSPADGEYDFQFKLFDSDIDGSQVGSDVNLGGLDVIDGYFTVELDFGNVFDGTALWLEVGIREGILDDTNDYTTLTARQLLTATPYALFARISEDVVGGVGITGSGSANKIPKFLDATTLDNSVIQETNSKIGIGTANPNRKLTVHNGGMSVFSGLSGENVSFTTDYYEVNNSNEDPMLEISEIPSDHITFHNGGSSVMKITDGKVGIGTNDPNYKLDVNGDINFTGTLYKNGSIQKEVVAGTLSGPPPAYPFLFDISSIGNVQPEDVIVVVSGFKTSAAGTPRGSIYIRWEVTNSPYTLTLSLRVFDGLTGSEFVPGPTAPQEWLGNRVELSFIATTSSI
jgi:hypothetical protein